jgi:hypothetical protein
MSLDFRDRESFLFLEIKRAVEKHLAFFPNSIKKIFDKE